VAPLVLGDELTPEDQGEELARGDAAARVARREQATAVDLPAIPAIPGDEAREDRQEAQRSRRRITTGEPAPVRAKGNAAECRYLCRGQSEPLLKGFEGGQIGRKALCEEICLGALSPVVARPRVLLTPKRKCA